MLGRVVVLVIFRSLEVDLHRDQHDIQGTVIQIVALDV